MATAVDTLINDVEELLSDTANTRWAAAEHLANLNEGMRALVELNPLVNVVKTSITLAAGVEQTMPAGAIELISIDRNASGAPVNRVDKGDMDIINPAWMSATASATVKEYMYDQSAEDTFYVYPPQPSSSPGTVVAQIAMEPTAVTAGQNLPIEDRWVPALKEFMMFRAKSKDAEYAGEDGEAQQHYARFKDLSRGT